LSRFHAAEFLPNGESSTRSAECCCRPRLQPDVSPLRTFPTIMTEPAGRSSSPKSLAAEVVVEVEVGQVSSLPFSQRQLPCCYFVCVVQTRRTTAVSVNYVYP